MKHTLRLTLATMLLSTAIAEEPPELARTRVSYHAELDRATKPITNKYRAYLEAQRAAATKAGKLEVALAYDTELQALSGGSPTTTTPTVKVDRAPKAKITASERNEIEKRLSEKMWDVSDGSGVSFYFKRDGTFFRFEGPKPRTTATGNATWKVLDDGTVFFPIWKWNYMITPTSDTDGIFSYGEFTQDGTPRHGKEVPAKVSPDEKLPRNVKVQGKEQLKP